MSDAPPVSLSLIVSSIGRTDRLPRLAASLAQQTTRNFELIVVDQAEPGRLDSFMEALPPWLPVTRVTSPRGLSRGRNAGLRLVRGEIVGIPDDDAWLPDGLVQEIVARFAAHPAAAFLCGVTRDASGALSNGTFMDRPAAITRANVWNAGNSNGVFFRAAAARAVGGFDETLGVGSGSLFGAGEETDFLLRLLAAGETGLFLPDLVMHHDQIGAIDQKMSAADFLQRATLYAQGYGRVLRLHGYSVSYVGWRVFRNLGAAVLAAAAGDSAEMHRRWRWVRGILVGYGPKP